MRTETRKVNEITKAMHYIFSANLYIFSIVDHTCVFTSCLEISYRYAKTIMCCLYIF